MNDAEEQTGFGLLPREAFENYMRAQNACVHLGRHAPGMGYRTVSVERAWKLWQAARASMNRTPAGMSEPAPHMDGVFSVKNGEWRARVGGVLQAAVWDNYEDAWAAYKARKNASPAPEGAGMSEPAMSSDERRDALYALYWPDTNEDTSVYGIWCEAWKQALTPPAVVPEQGLTEDQARDLFNEWYEKQPMPQLLALLDPQQAAHNAFEFGRSLGAAPAAVREPAPSYPAAPPSEEKK